MLTKAETITRIAEKLTQPKHVVTDVLDALLALAVAETAAAGQCLIPGFGKLVKAERQARPGRNPQTGEPLTIPAKTTVKFRLSKTLKDAIVPPSPPPEPQTSRTP